MSKDVGSAKCPPFDDTTATVRLRGNNITSFLQLPNDVLFFLFRVILVSDTIDVKKSHPNGLSNLFSLAQTCTYLHDNFCAFLLRHNIRAVTHSVSRRCPDCDRVEAPPYVLDFLDMGKTPAGTLRTVSLDRGGSEQCDHMTSRYLAEIVAYCPLVEELRFIDGNLDGSRESLLTPFVPKLKKLKRLKVSLPRRGFFDQLLKLPCITSIGVRHFNTGIRQLITTYLQRCQRPLNQFSISFFADRLPCDEHGNALTRRHAIYVHNCILPAEHTDSENTYNSLPETIENSDDNFVNETAILLNEFDSVLGYHVTRMTHCEEAVFAAASELKMDTRDDFVRSSVPVSLDSNTRMRFSYEIIAHRLFNGLDAFLRLREKMERYCVVLDTGLVTVVQLPRPRTTNKLIITSMSTSAFLDDEHKVLLRSSSTDGEFSVETLMLDALSEKCGQKWNQLDDSRRESLISDLRQQVFGFLACTAERLRTLCIWKFEGVECKRKEQHNHQHLLHFHSDQPVGDLRQIERCRAFMSLAVAVMSRARNLTTIHICDSFIVALEDNGRLEQMFRGHGVRNELQTLSIHYTNDPLMVPLLGKNRAWGAESFIKLGRVFPQLMTVLAKNCGNLKRICVDLDGSDGLIADGNFAQHAQILRYMWRALFIMAKKMPHVDVSSLEVLLQKLEDAISGQL